MGDTQTDKTSRWSFTAYAHQWNQFETMPEIVAEWGWQKEICPDTQREHYQGFIRTKRQVRASQMFKIFPGVHVEVARNWAALLKYCKKEETAVTGSQVHQISSTKAMTMAQAMTKLASHVQFSPPLTMEQATDEKFLKNYNEVQYWGAVKELLRINPDEVALWTQPQYFRAWTYTKQIWIELSIENMELQTDRQTDENLLSDDTALFETT